MSDVRHESTGSLLSEVLSHVSALFRSEVDLARAEIDQTLRRALAAIGMIVAAIVVALTALNVLSAALVAGLTEAGLESGWAALIVGVVFGIIAFALISKGMSDLKLSSIAPSRTAENVKRDAKAMVGTQNANS